MREIPQLFSTPMAEAILDKRKTKTRRTQGLELVNNMPDEWKLVNLGMFEHPGSKSAPEQKPWTAFGATFTWKPYGSSNFLKCPYQPGDLLWVREEHYQYGTWALVKEKTKNGNQKWKFIHDRTAKTLYTSNPPASFRISRNKENPNQDWWYKRLGRFMPKSAARIWLQITDIKVERLNDITEDDSLAEGIVTRIGVAPDYFTHYQVKGTPNLYNTARQAFMYLWQSINGSESLTLNPWVWVISFKVLSTTGKPKDIQDKSGFDSNSRAADQKQGVVVGSGLSLKSSLSGDEKRLANETRQLPRDDERKEGSWY
jgi:hypothetical protein